MSEGLRIADALGVALREAASKDPSTLRATALAAVREAARAPCALFYTLAELTTGRQIARNLVIDGDGSALEAMCRVTLQHPGRYVVGLPDIGRASTFERRAFVESSALWRCRDTWRSRLLTRELYAAQGVGDQIRLLPADGGRALGWIGAFRFADQPLFGPGDCRRLAPLVEPVTQLLALADRQEREAAPRQPGFAVALPDGQIEQLTPVAAQWLGCSRTATLVAQVLREAPPSCAVPLSASVALVVEPLEGPGGQRRLIRIEPLAPIVRPPDADSSPTQRHIAEMLTAAATYHEIARHLGCSAETVRSHVRAIYDRLDVSNRTELSQALYGGLRHPRSAARAAMRRSRP